MIYSSKKTESKTTTTQTTTSKSKIEVVTVTESKSTERTFNLSIKALLAYLTTSIFTL